MKYQEYLDFLFSSLPMYQRDGAAAYKNNLDTTLALDQAHGHPHRSYKCIHIAGTNGKGSVSHMLAAILQSAGYKTGLYTSPHLLDFRERIRVNGKMIPKWKVGSYVDKNRELIQKLSPSFFEMTADLAFLHFQEENIDIAVVETGMGGRLDSTNIINPVLSIITNIGLDHMRFLGDSIEKIAFEKAGIIKQNISTIIGESHNESAPVFIKQAEKLDSKLIFADRKTEHHSAMMTTNRKINHHFTTSENDYKNLECDLGGEYQKKNIATVLQATETLRKEGISISLKSVYQGISNVSAITGFRGRWEEIGHNPLQVCDTAHNPDGINYVVNQIRNTPRKNLFIVWGMVSDKDTDKILSMLPTEAEYFFTRANVPRSLGEKELHKAAKKAGLKGESYANVKKAYLSALTKADEKDLIFIGGSTFIVADLLKYHDK